MVRLPHPWGKQLEQQTLRKVTLSQEIQEVRQRRKTPFHCVQLTVRLSCSCKFPCHRYDHCDHMENNPYALWLLPSPTDRFSKRKKDQLESRMIDDWWTYLKSIVKTTERCYRFWCFHFNCHSLLIRMYLVFWWTITTDTQSRKIIDKIEYIFSCILMLPSLLKFTQVWASLVWRFYWC